MAGSQLPRGSLTRVAGTGALLALVHLIGCASFLDAGTNLIFFCTNLFFALVGFFYSRSLERFRWSAYLAGYLILFLILLVYARRPLLLILTIFLYAPLFRFPRILGYCSIFLFSILALTGYWWSVALIGSLLYTMLLALMSQRDRVFSCWLFGLGAILLMGLFLPLSHLLVQSSPQTMMAVVTPQLRRALGTSLLTSGLSTLITLLLGVPLGYCLARMDLTGKAALDAAIDLPILIPQTAVGIAILAFVGSKTPLGAFLESHGIRVAGSALGIVCCQVFVSAPFLIRAAQSAFQEINPKLEHVSRSLGASAARSFRTIALPLASPGILNGCVLAFSRALSEAGSLMIVAYRPLTIPIYTNEVFIQYGIAEAVPVTALFTIMCLSGFISLKWLVERRRQTLIAA